ncbi:MAG: glycosyltransferase family 4 protein [Anaerolineales bacterium]
MTETGRPRILLALVGDIERDIAARVKYGYFARALNQECGEVQAVDVTLRGLARWLNAARVFHPDFHIWRERFWKNIYTFAPRSRRVARAVKKHQPQVVLQLGAVFDAGLYQSSAPVLMYTDYTAQLSARRASAGRSPFSPQQRRRWLEMESAAYQRARHIFVRSQMVLDSLVGEYQVPAGKISIVGGGVNFSALPELSAQIRHTEEPIALFIGKEFLRKGGDVLLQAFALVRREFPAARLALVTGERIPAGLPMAGVDLLSPTWERDSLMELYRQSDVFVLPSRLETWGDVLPEAMAFGLPCIGVQSDAMGEIITGAETGLIVPPEDPQALAAALLRLFRDPDLRARMGRAGRRRVEALFTWERVAAAMCPVIEKIIQQR